MTPTTTSSTTDRFTAALLDSYAGELQAVLPLLISGVAEWESRQRKARKRPHSARAALLEVRASSRVCGYAQGVAEVIADWHRFGIAFERLQGLVPPERLLVAAMAVALDCLSIRLHWGEAVPPSEWAAVGASLRAAVQACGDDCWGR